eukprot:6117374-Alexandrium_andersonii.AAC.1
MPPLLTGQPCAAHSSGMVTNRFLERLNRWVFVVRAGTRWPWTGRFAGFCARSTTHALSRCAALAS